MPDKDKDPETRTNQTDDSSAQPQGAIARETAETQEAIDILRNKEIFSAAMDGRDVSIVYIRRDVKNYYGGEERRQAPEGAQTAPPPPPRRIGELVLNSLPQWQIDQAVAVYIPMTKHDEALNRLRQHGLIVLYGEDGSGKRTAAIRLLTQLFHHNLDLTAFYEINPGVKLVDLNPDDIPDHAGMLLENGDASVLHKLDHFYLNALQNRLDPQRNANALIILVEQPPRNFPSGQRDFLQPWQWQWPQPILSTQQKILQRHFRYLARYDSDLSPEHDTVFAELSAHDSLHPLLSKPLRPAQLEELAQLLIKVMRGSFSLDEAISRFEQRAQAEVEAWFAASHDSEVETLLIATAVFSGVGYTDISDANKRLRQAFGLDEADAREEKDKAPHLNSLFARHHPLMRQLKQIHAHEEMATQYGHFGEAPVKVIKLDDERWQWAVLGFVWQYDAYRRPLLDWLISYATHPRHALRTRAAAAMGALALTDFSVIEAEVLRDWAGSLNPDTRRSAAQVLGITIWNEHLSGPSSRLLHAWASQKSNWRWQWTAATAYAGWAGPRFPQQTLDDIQIIARQTVAKPQLLEPLLRAIHNYYQAAQSLPDRRLMLLAALDKWHQMPEKRSDRSTAFPLRRTALIGFLYLLWPDKNDDVWEQLLADISQEGPYQKHGIHLLRAALNFRQPKGSVNDTLHPRKMAVDCIEQLIIHIGKYGDGDQTAQLESLLAALMAASIRAGRTEVDRLQYHAQRWQEQYDIPRSALEIILSLVYSTT